MPTSKALKLKSPVYIYLTDGEKLADQQRTIGKGVIGDYGEDGELLGIEILRDVRVTAALHPPKPRKKKGK
jgi:Protein of unknown function (DUF2283).